MRGDWRGGDYIVFVVLLLAVCLVSLYFSIVIRGEVASKYIEACVETGRSKNVCGLLLESK